ncbi:GNAT family N-acetyltransferase [Pseudomonas sp. 5P_3.1_Bac2]|uniref:GNAT family N-acetyltransferase n=1 Tax=Pseudomonas sp. 5P_3.1_Bac2 TaxID=2971617 RepID=UPI0021C8499C|nr:GNAT family N-acetyltransferase [Pseudomonas sp. 5P_3.1_Bac2]MCU1715589.1 GNAT family N-acetyltransferase [Pseudomonas sp. 5P_3.1_Bac2]
MLKIRRATREDAPTALEIRRLAIQHQCLGAYTAEQIQRWTEVSLSEAYQDWVARDYHLACLNAQPIASGALNPSTGEVDALFVLPDYARQGLGQQMLAHLEALARQAGLTQLRLEATLNAVDFYRRRGFTGEQQALHQSSTGLQLACVPMTKALT